MPITLSRSAVQKSKPQSFTPDPQNKEYVALKFNKSCCAIKTIQKAYALAEYCLFGCNILSSNLHLQL